VTNDLHVHLAIALLSLLIYITSGSDNVILAVVDLLVVSGVAVAINKGIGAVLILVHPGSEETATQLVPSGCHTVANPEGKQQRHAECEQPVHAGVDSLASAGAGSLGLLHGATHPITTLCHLRRLGFLQSIMISKL